MSVELIEKVDEEFFDSDGDLTIYNGIPFTGIGYDPFPDGSGVEYETSYKNGLPHGYKKKWYTPDQMAYEVLCENGLKHGKEIHWYPGGEKKSESLYEFGINICSTKWDEKGNIVERFSIDPESPNYRLLEQYRNSAD
ncbi:MAG: hypothetical protein R3208_09420 [Ketobacteraceae bacterium]|nr:hypothetical protein [Ketobacteraceae bacterium]